MGLYDGLLLIWMFSGNVITLVFGSFFLYSSRNQREMIGIAFRMLKVLQHLYPPFLCICTHRFGKVTKPVTARWRKQLKLSERCAFTRPVRSYCCETLGSDFCDGLQPVFFLLTLRPQSWAVAHNDNNRREHTQSNWASEQEKESREESERARGEKCLLGLPAPAVCQLYGGVETSKLQSTATKTVALSSQAASKDFLNYQ